MTVPLLLTYKDALRLTESVEVQRNSYPKYTVVLPKGTIIRLMRYKPLPTTDEQKQYVKFVVLSSPDIYLTMKKHGGKAPPGGIEFLMLLCDARKLRVEYVEDFK